MYELIDAFQQGRLSRRQFMRHALLAGTSLSSVAAVLASPSSATASETYGRIVTSRFEQESSPPDEVQRFVFGATGDIINLDPVQANDAESVNVQELIHDSVAVIDPSFNIEPNLATSWDQSADGLTYTYRFREGVRFHDGSPLSADDVVFTIERILEGKYPEGRKKEKINMIDSFRKVDELTVEITLMFAYAPFAAAFGTQLIVPKAVVEALGDTAYSQQPIGCGPFRFIEWIPNDHVELEAFGDYWLTEPNLDEVVLRPLPENAVATANLLAGDIDAINRVAGANLQQLQSDDDIVVLTEPGYNYFFAGFRTLDEPFTDLRFRQAVYHATDFDAAIQALFPEELGQRAYGSVPPALWPKDRDALQSMALKQDQERSRALINELVEEGVLAEGYPVILAPPPEASRIKIAEIMATNLQEVGLNAELFRVDWAAYTSEVQFADHNLIYFLGTTPAIPDPDANLRWLFSTTSGHGRYLNIQIYPESAEWDRLLQTAQQSSDRDDRAEIYRSLQREMIERVIHIPLYHSSAVIAKQGYVKDLEPSRISLGVDLVEPWVNVYISGKE